MTKTDGIILFFNYSRQLIEGVDELATNMHMIYPTIHSNWSGSKFNYNVHVSAPTLIIE